MSTDVKMDLTKLNEDWSQAHMPGVGAGRSCNLHRDCVGADLAAAKFGSRAPHCRVENCKDCHGS